MSIFSGGSEISGMYLGSNEISEMYLGSNLIYSSGWPYETFRYSKDGGITWVDRGRPSGIGLAVYLNERITHVELPDSIETISSRSFSENRIEELLIPDSMISIGSQAFRYNKLTYVEFPETLEKIGQRAFRDNPDLAEVRFSRKTEYTASGTYASFDRHTNVVTYSSGQPYEILNISRDGGITWTNHFRPTRVAPEEFRDKGITHVEFPDSLEHIGDSAFRSNDIETLDIPKSVKTIGSFAFRHNNLTYIEFPETLESIGNTAFRGNPNLAEVRISSRTKYVTGNNYTFDSHTNIITYHPSDIIMGVEWDKQEDPTMTRIGESKDFVANIGVGDEVVQNDFDSAPIYREIIRETDDLGNTFVKIPKFYIRKTDDTDLFRLEISKEKFEGSYLPYVFWDFENNKELDYFYYGAYTASLSTDGTKLESKPGVAPLVSRNIMQFRDLARANGSGYQQLDIHAIDVIQTLFYVEFATLNSQSIHPGYTSRNDAATLTGGTDGVVASSGSRGTSTSHQFMYRGIEDLWGNVWQFVDGVNINDRQAWVCEDANSYESNVFSSPYRQLYYINAMLSGYVEKMGFDSRNPYAQFPFKQGGSSSTFYSDYYYLLEGQRVARFGGYRSTGVYAGLSCWYLSSSSTSVGSSNSGRLLKKLL